MHLKEIKETLDYFYYPLKTEIEQCIANGTIITKEIFKNLKMKHLDMQRYIPQIHLKDVAMTL